MRKFLLLALLLLAFSPSATAVITVVQNKSNTVVAGTSVAVTLNSNVTAGNVLFVGCTTQFPGEGINVTDTLANTWARVPFGTNSSPDFATFPYMKYVLTSIASGPDTITSSWGTVKKGSCAVMEISGLDPHGSLDRIAVANGNSSNFDSGPITTTFQVDEILIGLGGTTTTSESYTPEAGWTFIEGHAASSTFGDNILEYKIVSAPPATYNATATAGLATNWVMQIAAFHVPCPIPSKLGPAPIVQHNSVSDAYIQSSGTTIQIPFTVNVTAGNSLFIGCTLFFPGSLGPSGISDTLGNAWVEIGLTGTSSDFATFVHAFYVLSNIGSGADTITVIVPSNSIDACAIAEFPAKVLDQTAVNNNSVSNGNLDSGPVTTTLASEILIGFGGTAEFRTGGANSAVMANESAGYSPEAGWTQLEGYQTSCSCGDSILEFRTVLSTGTYNATATAPVNTLWVMKIATFQFIPVGVRHRVEIY